MGWGNLTRLVAEGEDRVSEIIRTYMNAARQALENTSHEAIEDAIQLLREAWVAGRTLFTMGNGGSYDTASHFANDLGKTAIVDGRGRIRAIALTDKVPLITAWANDASY